METRKAFVGITAPALWKAPGCRKAQCKNCKRACWSPATVAHVVLILKVANKTKWETSDLFVGWLGSFVLSTWDSFSCGS